MSLGSLVVRERRLAKNEPMGHLEGAGPRSGGIGQACSNKGSLAETGEQQQFPDCRIKRLDQVFL